jgi:multiple sugar transport system permease protein
MSGSVAMDMNPGASEPVLDEKQIPHEDRERRLTVAGVASWVVALLFFSPILWIAMSALKTTDQVLATPPQFIFRPTFDNFVTLFQTPNIIKYFINSVVLSLVSVSIAIAVSYLAAYSFSRFKPPGTDFLMFLLLSTRFVPAAAFVIPFFQLFGVLHLKDTYVGLIIFYTMFSVPFSVWILKGFIDGVSPRFDETGLVNGASRGHVIFKVVLPQVKPGLVAAFVFNIIFVWNEFLFDFQLGGKQTSTIPVALFAALYQGGAVNWTYVATLGTAYVVPLAVLIYFFQKYLLVGMTFGTVRGEV